MEDELEQAFTSQTTDLERFNYLVTLLQDGGGYDGFMHSNFRKVFRVYEDWKRSGYVVWPFPGGRLDQPVSWEHDIDAMGFREEFYRLRAKVLKKSDALPFDQTGL